jgi:hypothetical protein
MSRHCAAEWLTHAESSENPESLLQEIGETVEYGDREWDHA